MNENISVQWTDFIPSVSQTFATLRAQSDFHDVTLVSDDHVEIPAHRVVLSSCSGLFEKILMTNKQPGMLLCLDGISARELHNILDYVYNGKTEIPQNNLKKFLKTGKRLQLRGLLEINMPKKEEYDNLPLKTYSEIQDENEAFNVQHSTSLSVPDVESFENEEFSIQTSTSLSVPGPDVESFAHIRSEFYDSNSDISKEQIEKKFEKIEKKFDLNDGTLTMDQLNEMIDGAMEKTENGVRCKKCLYVTKNKSHMREHVERHFEGLAFPCQYCELTAKSRLIHANSIIRLVFPFYPILY